MIIVTDKYQRAKTILSNSSPKALGYFGDKHREQLDGLLTYEFSTLASHPSAEHLVAGNSVIVRNLDKALMKFQILRTEEEQEDGKYVKRVYAENSAVGDLHGVVVKGTLLKSIGLEQAATHALQGTGWTLGRVEYAGLKDVDFSEYPTALAALYKIRDIYDLELEFSVHFDGVKVREQFVHFVKRRGQNTRKRFTYGKDLKGVTREEDRTDLVTALVGVGKADEEGNRLTFADYEAMHGGYWKPKGQDWVGDDEALQKYGNNGKHIFGRFELSSVDNVYELLDKTAAELKKVCKPRMTYTVSVILLERLTKYEHEKVRLGDTIIVKDTTFEPALLVEARVLELIRSYTDPSEDSVLLGEFVPIFVDKNRQIEAIQQQINSNIAKWEAKGETVIKSVNEPTNKTPDMLWLDLNLEPNVMKRWDATAKRWVKASATTAEEIGAETPTGAQKKADKAQDNAAQDATDKANSAIDTASKDATNKANQAKDDAVQIAGEDATNKADAAEEAAKSYADGVVESVEASMKEHAEQVAKNAEDSAKLFTESYAEKELFIGDTAPADTTRLWIDTTKKLNVLKRYNPITKVWDAATPTTAGEVGAETPAEAQKKADAAKSAAEAAAKKYTDGIQVTVDENAKKYAEERAKAAEDAAKVFTESYAQKEIKVQNTTPTDTTVLWLDTTKAPNIMKRYDPSTSKWVNASPTSAAELGAETPEGAKVKADAAQAAALAAAKTDAQTKADAAKQAAITAAAADAATKSDAAKAAAIADAKVKADAAQAAAIKEAQAQAAAAEEAAKAHADGIVTAEEQARITQADANLAAAKKEAADKAAAAETAAKAAAALDAKSKADAAQAAAAKDASTKADAAQAAAAKDAQTKADAAREAAKTAAAIDAAAKADAAKAAAIADAQVKADAAKNAAIAAAATDAKTKADAAQKAATDRANAVETSVKDFASNAGNITQGTIAADRLYGGTIDAQKANIVNINAGNIIAGTLDASKAKIVNIDAGAITAGILNAARIAAGTVTADKLHVLAKSLVANTSITGNDSTGWSVSKHASSTVALRGSANMGDVLVHGFTTADHDVPTLYDSTMFEVDPNQTYKFNIGMFLDKNNRDASQYFGFKAYDKNGVELAVQPINPTTGALSGTPRTNPYFWSGKEVSASWRSMEGYVLSSQAGGNEAPQGRNIQSSYIMHPATKFIRMRFYSGYYPTVKNVAMEVLWHSPSVTTVDSGLFTADRITAGTIDASKINVLNVNAGNVNTGTLDANKVNVTNLKAQNIVSGTLDASKVTVANLSASVLQAGIIDASKVTINNLDASKITAGTLSADKIKGGTIDANNVTILNLNAGNIVAGTLDASKVTIANLTANVISSGTLDAAKVTVSNLSASVIQTGVLDAAKVQVNNLSAAKITSGTMSADRITGGTIDATKVAVTNLNAANINSGTLNADKVTISNGKVAINGAGVTVSDADFLVKDAKTGFTHSMQSQTNLISDHSFELLTTTGNISEQIYRPIDPTYVNKNAIDGWMTVGTPMITDGYTTDAPDDAAAYGRKAVRCNINNYMWTDFPAKAGKQYTISFYSSKPYYLATTAAPQVAVEYMKAGILVSSEVKNFAQPPTPVGQYVRYGFTVTAPAGLNDERDNRIRLRFRTNNYDFLMYDGIQAVQGSTAVPYDSEDSLFMMSNNRLTPVRMQLRNLNMQGNTRIEGGGLSIAGQNINGVGFEMSEILRMWGKPIEVRGSHVSAVGFQSADSRPAGVDRMMWIGWHDDAGNAIYVHIGGSWKVAVRL
jgi:phage minor structural protein